jgi:DNA-binding beta-propeller fold protein YncE
MSMRRLATLLVMTLLTSPAWAQGRAGGAAATYKVLSTTKVGGAGGWDHVYADVDGRRLYVPRTGTGAAARILVYDLDTMKPAGTIAGVSAHAVAVDSASGHGFSASRPIAMWDSKTLQIIKTIPVQAEPGSIVFDPFKSRVFVFSDGAPNTTVIDAAAGTVAGTIALGGKPRQAAADGEGHVYVAIEDKDEIAVIDTAAMTVSARYDLDGIGAGPRGLAFDPKNKLLFVACANATMVYVSAKDGKFLYALPIGVGANAVAFNPATNEIFSAQDQGTVTISRVSGPTNFAMVSDVETLKGAKNIALDTKTGKLYLVAAEHAPLKDEGTTTPAELLRRGAVVPNSFSIIQMGK